MMHEKLFELGFKFVIAAIATTPNEDGAHEILHLVGYMEYPSDGDLELLAEELKADDELGLTHLNYPADYMLLDYARDETV